VSEVWGLRTLLDDTIEPGHIRLVPLSCEALQRAFDAVGQMGAALPLSPLPPCRCSVVTDIPATDGQNGGENTMAHLPPHRAADRAAFARFNELGDALSDVSIELQQRDETIARLRAEGAELAHALDDLHDELEQAERDNADLHAALHAAHNTAAGEFSRGYSERSRHTEQLVAAATAASDRAHDLRRDAEQKAAEAEARMVGMAHRAAEIRDAVRDELPSEFRMHQADMAYLVRQGDATVDVTFTAHEAQRVANHLNALRSRVLHAIEPQAAGNECQAREAR
jgi:chromosome segregation ATPase